MIDTRRPEIKKKGTIRPPARTLNEVQSSLRRKPRHPMNAAGPYLNIHVIGEDARNAPGEGVRAMRSSLLLRWSQGARYCNILRMYRGLGGPRWRSR